MTAVSDTSAPSSADKPISDYFDSRLGQIHQGMWRSRTKGPLRDALHDIGFFLRGGARKAVKIAAATPVRKVLVTGVSRPDRPGEMEAVKAVLSQTRHQVTFALTPMADGVGKFDNIGRALAELGRPLADFDWVVIVDDDLGPPAHFLDLFLGLAEDAGLKIAQPAHRLHSYTSFAITQRRFGSLVRTTRWVETGPLIAVHRDAFELLASVPATRWDWGLSVLWAQIADQRGWPMGVVDGAPVEHRHPVADGYDPEVAIAEARGFLAEHKVTFTRAECHGDSKIVTAW